MSATMWNENEERFLFEETYPLPPEVEYRESLLPNGDGAYAVLIKPMNGSAFWTICNSAFQVQTRWEVWKECVKAHQKVSK